MLSNSYHKSRSNTNEYDPWVFKISNKESFRLFTCFSSYSKFLLCTISSSFKLVSLRWKVFYGTWDKNSKKYNKVEFEGMNVLAKGGQIWSSISIFIFPIYVYNNSRPLLIIRNIICSVYVVLCILIIFRMFEKRFDISWKTKSPFFYY